MVFHPHPSDPFYEFMKPPEDETPAQKTARLKREADAQRINDEIDDQIKEDRNRIKKEREIVKVLLLGQSESGKSTTLKNFRMRFAPVEWELERNGWRAVVQLNIVRSINTILKVVEAEMNGSFAVDSDEDGIEVTPISAEDIRFTDRHQLLMIRLAPLAGVETELKRRIGDGSEPITPGSGPQYATPFDDAGASPAPRRREFAVRSWKDVLSRSIPDQPDADDFVTSAIAECKEDMKTLWNDSTVRVTLKKHSLQLGDTAGFFLNDLDRVATKDFTVTDDDIVRARLRTVGIQEYAVIFKEVGRVAGWEWRIFDVGGCRTLRKAWLSYFENVNVIIFLSPVSVFDQRLEEDAKVNRLEDSIILWTALCASKLLSKTQLILFLNKCDLLRRKLKRGVRINQYLPSFGDRENEVITVVKCLAIQTLLDLREKFKDLLRQHSPERRSVYIYATTATDTTATGVTLETVRDGVLRENLAASQLI
ncbi:heterotrimeric G protein alpha subunit [Crepidotus variabilis]|uniref:Heterotrimeric G protein alpha subunit n=1 Tax=Crepidotus variabilis TaxID=179855 RepID=A0A9P6EKA9_9AGAR|nr:heterotrimeric G protein alpha subunit [Crepidotus variabilis]